MTQLHFQSLILDAAIDAGHTLVNDERELQRWIRPEERRQCISNEISRLVKERKPYAAWEEFYGKE